jgi:hypothetical protein
MSSHTGVKLGAKNTSIFLDSTVNLKKKIIKASSPHFSPKK